MLNVVLDTDHMRLSQKIRAGYRPTYPVILDLRGGRGESGIQVQWEPYIKHETRLGYMRYVEPYKENKHKKQNIELCLLMQYVIAAPKDTEAE